MSRRGKWIAIVVAVAASVLSACGYDDTSVPKPPAEASYTPAPASDCNTDPATLVSEPADGNVAPGSTVDKIRRGEQPLRVGVSADTYLMAARNPATNRIQGFDIEVVKAIGEAIFGPGFNFNRDVQLRVITAGDRIPLLQSGDLDLVVRNFTINSCRKDDIAFSAVYYDATQKVLVRSDVADSYSGVSSLADQRVCAPNGSTSLDNIHKQQPDAILIPALTHTGCLIKFQRGEVDAITGDDTVLAGLAAQDPYAAVPPSCDDPDVVSGEACQDSLEPEPYGVGVSKDDPQLVAFVNYALEQMVSSGDWMHAYNRWLKDELGTIDETPGAITP
jgi:polar amino acid transport system substrate-binding protein